MREMKRRCAWAKGKSKQYVDYHDHQWGVPVVDDRRLFECIVLEGAQAGLSWEIILNKREGYRAAFYGFDPGRVARMGEHEVHALLSNPDIVRNRRKITSAVRNAQAFLCVQDEYGSFARYMWRWVEETPITNRFTTSAEVPATTQLAVAMSRDLKKRGFSFVGPTIWYAHMQAVGMVNDHTTDCFRHSEIPRGKVQVP